MAMLRRSSHFRPWPLRWGSNRERSSVLNIRKALARLSKQRKKWRKLLQEGASLRAATFMDAQASHLKEVQTFGSNPGDLRMFTYLPPEVSAERALLVVLHGC